MGPAQRSGVTLEQDCNNISQFSHTSAQASYSVPMGSDNNSSQHLHTLTSHLGGSWIRDDLHEVNEEDHVLYCTVLYCTVLYCTVLYLQCCRLQTDKTLAQCFVSPLPPATAQGSAPGPCR